MEGILRLDSLRIPLRQVRYLYLATVYVLTSDPPPSGLLSILGPRSCPYTADVWPWELGTKAGWISVTLSRKCPLAFVPVTRYVGLRMLTFRRLGLPDDCKSIAVPPSLSVDHPIPTKTPILFGQSLAKVCSSFNVFSQVFLTNEASIAFFSYRNLFVIRQSMASLLLMVFSHRFFIIVNDAGPFSWITRSFRMRHIR